MAIREIVTIGSEPRRADHPILGGVNVMSAQLDKTEVQEIVEHLLDTMHEHPNCIGLAAPQIGYNARIAVIRDRVTSDGKDIALIDPTIVSATGSKDGKREACMSIPGWVGLVKRRPVVEVEYTSVDGEMTVLAAHDFFARVIQHEIDHLDGVLYPSVMREQDEMLRVVDGKVVEAATD